jgi:U3 small nucleolar RNA-associated protein 13
MFGADKMLVATNDQNMHVYSLPSFSSIKEIAGYNEEIIDATFVGENGSHIAVATNSEQVRIFNLETKDCNMINGHTDIVIALSSSSDGHYLATASKDRTVKVWRLNLQSAVGGKKYVAVGECIGHTEAVGAVSMSRKSMNFMVTGGQDRTIKCWDISQLGMFNPLYVQSVSYLIYRGTRWCRSSPTPFLHVHSACTRQGYQFD